MYWTRSSIFGTLRLLRKWSRTSAWVIATSTPLKLRRSLTFPTAPYVTSGRTRRLSPSSRTLARSAAYRIKVPSSRPPATPTVHAFAAALLGAVWMTLRDAGFVDLEGDWAKGISGVRPGQTHEGLRSYGWGTFGQVTGAETL